MGQQVIWVNSFDQILTLHWLAIWKHKELKCVSAMIKYK